IYGLVRRYQNEIFCTEFARKPAKPARGKNVVLNGFGRVLLHQRHVFVRRRVKNNVRPKAFEYLAHTRFVGDIGDQRNKRNVLERSGYFAFDAEKEKLRPFDQQKFFGLEIEDLADELRTARTARTSDHNRVAAEKFFQIRVVKLHGFASQKIFDLDVANTADG